MKIFSDKPKFKHIYYETYSEETRKLEKYDSKIIRKNEYLPKEIFLENERIILENIEIEKYSNTEFVVNVYLDYKGNKTKINFVYYDKNPKKR